MRFNTLDRISATAVTVVSVVTFSAGAQAFTPHDYNLVVFEDLYSNSEVEGSSFIGGNLYGNSSNYCIKCHLDEPFDGIGLKVVGDINGSTKQVNNGAGVEYGGSLNANINTNGGGSQTQNSDLSQEFSQLRTELVDLSQQLAGMASNSTVTTPGQQPGAVTFNSSGEALAVFDIDIESLFSSKTQQIELNLNGSDTVVINVHGSAGSWTQGHMVGALASDAVQERIVWNFYEAETLELNNALHGSLLAVNADVTNRNELEGTVVVKSLNQSGEVHMPTFAGTLPSIDEDANPKEVPEPSLLLGSASLLLGTVLKKRGQR